jgi:EAL domain-containing protein (putative c-di-GMP-specific phosphodiesterase class I)
VQWYEQKFNPGRLALNISVNQLYKNEFIGEFQQMMAETGCKAQWLELEITEDQMMKDPDKALKILHQLSKMGITLTIDDFGLGYSSFAYLQKLPIGKLKIDRTFIRNIPQDQNNVAIVKSIIGLAKNLNLDLIAEGIRNREQKEFIIQNGCKKIQGYYYAKALSCKEMEQFLKQ